MALQNKVLYQKVFDMIVYILPCLNNCKESRFIFLSPATCWLDYERHFGQKHFTFVDILAQKVNGWMDWMDGWMDGQINDGWLD